MLRNTGWTIADKARGVSHTTMSDSTIVATFTNNSSNIAYASTPTHHTNNNNNTTPITPKRSATPLKSPLHSASSSNLRISTESPMKPSSDGYISPTPKSTRGGVTSPTASSARQSVVPSGSQKSSQVSRCSILSICAIFRVGWHGTTNLFLLRYISYCLLLFYIIYFCRKNKLLLLMLRTCCQWSHRRYSHLLNASS